MKVVFRPPSRLSHGSHLHAPSQNLFRPPRRTINTVTAPPSSSIRAASIFTGHRSRISSFTQQRRQPLRISPRVAPLRSRQQQHHNLLEPERHREHTTTTATPSHTASANSAHLLHSPRATAPATIIHAAADRDPVPTTPYTNVAATAVRLRPPQFAHLQPPRPPEQPPLPSAAQPREEGGRGRNPNSGERVLCATCQHLIGQSTGQLWSTGQSQQSTLVKTANMVK